MIENKKQAALDYIKSMHVEYDSDPVIAYCAFGAGAEWMQKEMIEKACEWLYVYYPTLERSKSAEDAWDKFKKAMEE